MPPSDFDRCVALTLLEEDSSGLGKVTTDDGGVTKWGIASRFHPAVDVAALTRDGAKAIYFREYWGPLRCAELPAGLAMVVFDGAVNPGQGWAAKALQAAVGVAQDGKVGDKTIFAARNAGWRQCVTFSAARLARFESSSSAPTNLGGWRPRVLRVLWHAAQMEAA